MTLETSLSKIQNEIQSLLQVVKQMKEQGTWEQIMEEKTKEEQIELNLNLAYTLSSVYYSYLKINQNVPAQHKIFEEIARIQTAFQKYHPIEQNQYQTNNQQPKLDKDAAKRMIKPNLKSLDNDNNYQQKQQKLIEEETNNAERFQGIKDIWEDKDTQQKQKMIRGNLIPQTGHLNWKQEIEKIMKK